MQAQPKVKARVFSFRGGNAQDKPQYLRVVGRRFPKDPTFLFKAKGDGRRWLVELVGYPGTMAGGSKTGAAFCDNEAITPTCTLTREKREDNYGAVNATLGKDEPWVLFYDTYFDVAKTPELKDRWKSQVGKGPCAMAYNPDEVVRAAVKVSNYSCEATLLYAPTTTETHLVLWDLHGQTKDRAKRYMKTVEVDFKAK